MFIGHYALAFAAKRVAPRASLGTLIAAAQFLDMLWPIFLLLGVEHIAPGDRYFTNVRFINYPWSHSLAMAVVWSLLAGVIYGALTHDRWTAIVVGLLVVSHWVLDFVVHRPDLQLYPGGSAHVGLDLWDSVVATIVVEGLMYVVGVTLYTRGTRARDGAGRYLWWSLVAFLAVSYAANFLGPAPTNMTVVAWSGLALWLLPIWGWWADRHRTTSEG